MTGAFGQDVSLHALNNLLFKIMSIAEQAIAQTTDLAVRAELEQIVELAEAGGWLTRALPKSGQDAGSRP